MHPTSERPCATWKRARRERPRTCVYAAPRTHFLARVRTHTHFLALSLTHTHIYIHTAERDRIYSAVREIGNLLPNNRRQRRTCYALCHILDPVSAAHTSISRMDSNSNIAVTSSKIRGFASRESCNGTPLGCSPISLETVFLFPGHALSHTLAHYLAHSLAHVRTHTQTHTKTPERDRHSLGGDLLQDPPDLCHTYGSCNGSPLGCCPTSLGTFSCSTDTLSLTPSHSGSV